MVFNSAPYLVFFFVVLVFYWLPGNASIKGIRYQNAFLLLASYFFYGYWDWLLLILITSSTLVDFVASRQIYEAKETFVKKLWLGFSVAFNLGLLGLFKYYDFFAASLAEAINSVSPGAFPNGGDSILLHLILPVGISFYTFQTMSYTIDVYRGVIEPERNLLTFALFVCFFPQLVAGPIERASDLLPQLKAPHRLNWKRIEEGAWLLLMGYFLKVYVADNLGPIVDKVFFPSRELYLQSHGATAMLTGPQVLVSSIAFTMQIYCDFAGYSYIAMGSARWLGIDLSLNFNGPELAAGPSDLWRRWHITLTQWFRDYVYIPLGGSRGSRAQTMRNVIIVFLLSGLWHGASWNFVIWGGFHGLWIAIHSALRGRLQIIPADAPVWLSRAGKIASIVLTFLGLCLLFIPFRAYDLDQTLAMAKALFMNWGPGGLSLFPTAGSIFSSIIKPIALLVLLDLGIYFYGSIFWVHARPIWARIIIYFSMAYCIIILGVFGKDVIYFAF
ncbi:MAG: MBOAT family protein [Leptospiraceae bacterium]|nr:MBOAT family protein [Leptospiraceae bacterium]MCB1303641.1 MBOAT family protein [Leptospiraceae bacterium]